MKKNVIKSREKKTRTSFNRNSKGKRKRMTVRTRKGFGGKRGDQPSQGFLVPTLRRERPKYGNKRSSRGEKERD